MSETLNETPGANRLHIGFFGKRNSGKSSLMNAFTGQEVSIVSDVAGTTTDLVSKPMEVHPLGACVLMDTAGFDDEGELGKNRVEKTKFAAQKADIAVIVCTDTELSEELAWYHFFEERHTPVAVVINKTDCITNIGGLQEAVTAAFKQEPVLVSAQKREGIEALKERLVRLLPENYG